MVVSNIIVFVVDGWFYVNKTNLRRRKKELLGQEEKKKKEKREKKKTQKAHRPPPLPVGRENSQLRNPAYAWRFTPRIEPATSLVKAQGTQRGAGNPRAPTTKPNTV